MRYIRQERLDFIPKNFQEIIKHKKVVIVGCGGIGSPLAELLIKGGFLNLSLIDKDKVYDVNLHRQIYDENDNLKFKVIALKENLLKHNSKAKIVVNKTYLDEENIDDICRDSDLIIDATDNFESRIIINKYCEENNKDWIYNGAIRTELVSCIFYGDEKLFAKVFPKSPKNIKCSEFGILGSTAYASASLAYNQILKYFLGIKDYKLVKIDLWKNKMFEIKIK